MALLWPMKKNCWTTYWKYYQKNSQCHKKYGKNSICLRFFEKMG